MSYKTLPYLPTLPPSEQFTVQEALLLPKQDINWNNLLWDVTTAPVLEFFQSHLSSAYNLQQCLFFFFAHSLSSKEQHNLENEDTVVYY